MCEIKVKVLRGGNGAVNGISFVAGGETWSEDFILHCYDALRKGEGGATVSIDGEEVVLNGPNHEGETRQFRFKPTAEELEGLKTSIFAKGNKKPMLAPYGVLSYGFKIYLPE